MSHSLCKHARALASAAVLLVLVPAAPASDEGQAAALQVSPTSIQEFLNLHLYTHNGNSRGPSGTHHDLARNNIKSLFESYGLPTAFETFTYNGGTWENVVATKLGTTYPSQVFIIGAHYDSVGNPGADDNASGVAGVLEAARVISQYPSAYTIKFIAFDMEEAGLVGSNRYITAHPGETILGMISLDMIAYEPANPTNHALIYGRSASNPIKAALAAAIDEYSGGLTHSDEGQLDASDHAPFEAAGYQACLIIEGAVWDNPYYHTQQDSYDTPGNLNFTYAARMTASVVGWLVDAADVEVPVDKLDFEYVNGLPEYSSPLGGTRIRFSVAGVGSFVPQPGTALLHYNVGAGWQTAVPNMVQPNIYDAYLPPAPCGNEVEYYFSALATDGTEFIDPYHAPDMVYSTLASFGVDVVYENNFTANPNWATQPSWAFGTPTGGGSNNHDPTSGHTGLFVYGYNLNGDYTNNLPVKYLTTPAFNCTGAFGVQLEFWRWLGVESNSDYDEATVEISTNGANWLVIWRATDTNAAVSDSTWTLQQFDISAYADNQPAVYFRWGMGPTDSYVTYPGWNIDDVRLTALLCTPVAGDMNCDASIDFGDINPFVQALSDPAGWQATYPGCPVLVGDVSGNGSFGFEDINPFVALLTGN